VSIVALDVNAGRGARGAARGARGSASDAQTEQSPRIVAAVLLLLGHEEATHRQHLK